MVEIEQRGLGNRKKNLKEAFFTLPLDLDIKSG